MTKLTENTPHLQVSKLKALSPDNEIALKRLIRLFRACYGEHYPIQGVYDVNFWKNRIGSRLISMALWQGSEMVGHIAFCPDPVLGGEEGYGKNQVQILHVAYHPDYLEKIQENIDLLREGVDQLSHRQGWHSSYCYMPCTEVDTLPSHIEALIEEGLGLKKSAVLPEYFSGMRAESKDALDLSACCSLYIRIHKDPEEKKNLYLPSHIKGYIQRSSQHFSLKRDCDQNKDLSHVIHSDIPATVTRRFSLMDISHIYLQPSLIHDMPAKLLELRELQTQTDVILFINIEDPEAPKLIEPLLEQSFIVGGYFPLFYGYDHLILTKDKTSGESSISAEKFATAQQ